ncbi:MAG: phosphoenolpyruvate--protein phosphotransferase, partial [Alistipes sp.]|nr:phosphoenolpyruvate--protein phosphotransferase [Alistipes sp.]
MKFFETSVRASDGIAMGRAFVVNRCTDTSSYRQGTTAEEQSRFAEALAQSRTEIEALAADSDIFAAHLEIIDDEMLSDSVTAHLDEGMSAPDAVIAASAELVAMFEAIDDEYLAARSADIKDIFARIGANLMGGVKNPFKGVTDGDIIVDSELLPSDMALLDFTKIRGFVTAEGSATSHVCIIARNLSVPAVVGL